MRWVLAAFVVAWASVASAQTMTIPAGFAKAAGGDAYQALAQPGDKIAVQAYRAGEAELVTVAWQWKSDLPTRAGLARFDHDLVGRSRPDGAKEVSNTPMLDRDPMQVEVFDMLAGQRVYHRRLYAVDAKNVVHLWWTVCTAPATAIEPCEQAQRTMKLEISHAVALPAGASPPAPRQPPPPALPVSTEPWRMAIPAGYVETPNEAVSANTNMAKAMFGPAEMESHVFVSPAAARLLQTVMRMDAGDESPETAVANMDAGLADGLARSLTPGRAKKFRPERPALPAIGGNVVGSESTEEFDRRTLYALDQHHQIYLFNAVCLGPRAERADCVAALATMQLAPPNQVTAPSAEWGRAPQDSSLVQLVRVLLVVVAPLAALIWIAKNRQRMRRRVREPSV